MSTTTNYSLELPQKGQKDWNTHLNENFTKIDNEIHKNASNIGDITQLSENDLVEAIKNDRASLAENVQKFSEVDADILSLQADKANKSEVNILATEKANTVDLDTEKTERKAEIAVERARINSFTSLSEGSTTGDAELIDARVGADGTAYSNVGGAIRTQFNNISDYLISNKNILNNFTFENGYISTTDGTNNTYNQATRIRNISYIEVKKGSVLSCSNDVCYIIYFYDSEHAFISTTYNYSSSNYTFSEDCIVRLTFKYITESNFTTISDLTGKFKLNTKSPGTLIQNSVDELGNSIYTLIDFRDITSSITFENGYISTIDGTDSTYNQATRIRSVNSVDIKYGDKIVVQANSHYVLYFYDSNNNFLHTTDWLEGTYIYKSTDLKKVRIIISKINESSYTSKDDLLNNFFFFQNQTEDLPVMNITDYFTFENGYISTIDGTDSTYNASSRVRSTNYINLAKWTRFVSSYDVKYIVYFYDSNKKYIGNTDFVTGEYLYKEDDCLARLVIANQVETTITDISVVIQNFYMSTNPIEITKTMISESIEPIDIRLRTVEDITKNNTTPSVSWELGHILFDTGKDYSATTRIRTNKFFVKSGTILIPHVYGQPQVYFYNEDGTYKGTAVSLGLANASDGGFMDRANSLELLEDSYIRIVYQWVHGDNNFMTKFGSVDSFGATFRVIPPDYKIPVYIKNAILKRQTEIYNDDYFNLTFITDVHDYAYHEASAVYCANLTSQYFLNGGDLLSIPRYSLEETTRILAKHIDEYSKCVVPVLQTRGNHEMSQDIVTGRYTTKMWYEQVQKPLRTKDMVYNLNDKQGGYYYIDNEEYKVRIVNVNIFYNNAGGHAIGLTQIQWLCENAFDLSDKIDESEWKLLVFGHGHLLDNVDSSETVSTTEEKYLSNIFRSIANKTTVSNNYYAYTPNFANVKYTFLGYVCGHVHEDDIKVLDGYYHIVTTCDHPTSDLDGYERIFDSEYEYAFDLMNFDFSNGLINCLRIGAGNDRHIHYIPYVNPSSVSYSKLKGSTITWTSDNTSVATVSNGAITRVSIGFATIKAKDETGAEEYFMIKMI